MVKLLVIIIVVGYGWGAWKLWTGFKRTNFEPSLPNRIVLSLLWPALFVFNQSYRKNFQKALKG
jgi:cell division protein FtsW (lipid II flippase)